MNLGHTGKHNEHIGCTVTDCKHHCGEDDYCTLNKINVVNHSTPTREVEATDCGSFEPKM
ncbi:MAG TPA: DUF1540 domain-containing protein [Clostridiaceae bacterium]|jgi:hypothetical protein|nr:DUF1540 domain-containing protein [Clostridiaceae bacterium]